MRSKVNLVVVRCSCHGTMVHARLLKCLQCERSGAGPLRRDSRWPRTRTRLLRYHSRM